jgi:hypothetical protein
VQRQPKPNTRPHVYLARSGLHGGAQVLETRKPYRVGGGGFEGRACASAPQAFPEALHIATATRHAGIPGLLIKSTSNEGLALACFRPASCFATASPPSSLPPAPTPQSIPPGAVCRKARATCPESAAQPSSCRGSSSPEIVAGRKRARCSHWNCKNKLLMMCASFELEILRGPKKAGRYHGKARVACRDCIGVVATSASAVPATKPHAKLHPGLKPFVWPASAVADAEASAACWWAKSRLDAASYTVNRTALRGTCETNPGKREKKGFLRHHLYT